MAKLFRDKKGYLYRKIICPNCGRAVIRAYCKKILGPSDPRTGNAHTHKCYLTLSVNYEEQKLREMDYAFCRFLSGERDQRGVGTRHLRMI